jgi:uncharacterized membrane protein AbrB (regulator of aidB expression)
VAIAWPERLEVPDRGFIAAQAVTGVTLGAYAVLAVAFGAGANTTFIVTVQGLRVLVMVLLAPVIVRWLIPRAT